jgi:hypothetical protein
VLVAVYHLGYDVLPCQPQSAQNIGVGCTWIVIKTFNAPIVFSADFSGSAQNVRFEHLTRLLHLHRAEEAVAASTITQLSLAPFLLGREQAFDRAKLGKGMGTKQP